MNQQNHQKILKKFGLRLKQLRKAKELSLRSLAHEADVDFSMIYRIENGESNPSLLMLISLAEGLNMTVSELVDAKF